MLKSFMDVRGVKHIDYDVMGLAISETRQGTWVPTVVHIEQTEMTKNQNSKTKKSKYETELVDILKVDINTKIALS